MIGLANNEKAAMIKSMALESLGTMGSAISVLRADVGILIKQPADGYAEPTDLSKHLHARLNYENIPYKSG